MTVDVIAIVATYNEELFLARCVEHYREQGVAVYIIDNESDDHTMEIAKSYYGHGVIGIETLERKGRFSLVEQLQAKERAVARLDADWFINADTDEIRLAPTADQSLAEALSEVDELGYSLVNFIEFTFVPTVEEPDHEHDRYIETMKWYYHFAPRHPHHLKAWKAAAFPNIQLSDFGGHQIPHEPEQLSPVDFKFRHYLCLSRNHIHRKYIDKTFSAEELARGWHTYRATMTDDDVALPRQSELRRYTGDADLDASDPVTSKHLIYRPST